MGKIGWYKRLVSFFALTCACASAVFAQPADEIKKPAVRIEAPVHDFGSVSQGSKVIHDFVIKNAGTADLVVQRVQPACGCTVSTVMPSTIAPGTSGTIHVEFDTAGFSGEKLKTVRLYTNDIDEPSSMVTLKGMIEGEVLVEPKRVFLGEIIRGAAVEVPVEIAVRPGSKARISGVKVFSEHVALKQDQGDEKKRHLIVSLKPGAPLGELRDRVVVTLTNASSSSINIPIWGMISGAVRLKPSSLAFGIMEEGKALSRTVRVENVGQAPVSIKAVKSNNPAVTGSVKALKEGRLYEVAVTVDPKQVSKDLRAVLELETSSDVQTRIPLSVYGTLPPKAESTKG